MAADPGAIIAQFDRMVSERSQVEQHWRECYDYTMPVRGQQLRTPGATGQQNSALSGSRDQQATLYDSTAADCVRLHSSSLMSGLTPANSRWFDLEADAEDDEAERWLDGKADDLWRLIHAANYDAAGFEAMTDMSIAGQFCMYIDEDEERGLTFDLWPLAGVYCSASRPGGIIDTVFRRFDLTAEQAANEYGPHMVSESTRAKAESASGRYDRVQFIQAIYPRTGASGQLARNLPVASCHVETQAKRLVRESGYHDMPCVVPRWTVVPDSVYAVGPVRDALPDIKTLNEVKRFVLANADLAVAGMWAATDDGVLNPKTLKIGPRKVIVVANPDNIKPLAPAGRFDVSALIVAELQRSVRKVMLADQLQPQDGPAMTATEVHVRVELIRQLLGPVYGRLQAEYLTPLVERCWGIAYRAGYFGPAPESLQGRNVRVHYRSPIARSQKLADVMAMERFEASLLTLAQARPQVLDVYDWDEATREKAEKLGVPMDVLVSEAELAAAREQQARQQAAQDDAQAAGSMASLSGMLAKAGLDSANARKAETAVET